MKITLQVGGRERTFSEEELVNILEKYFRAKETTKAADSPMAGKHFLVNPKAINLKLFEKQREDEKQECTRKLILEAFEYVKVFPTKYDKTFMTYIPKKEWDVKTIRELENVALQFGHMADWVEQALEWAQRISNGETWEKLCNEHDTIDSYRLIQWKDGHLRIVGGCAHVLKNTSATNIRNYNSSYYRITDNVVPLVVWHD